MGSMPLLSSCDSSQLLLSSDIFLSALLPTLLSSLQPTPITKQYFTPKRYFTHIHTSHSPPYTHITTPYQTTNITTYTTQTPYSYYTTPQHFTPSLTKFQHTHTISTYYNPKTHTSTPTHVTFSHERRHNHFRFFLEHRTLYYLPYFVILSNSFLSH